MTVPSAKVKVRHVLLELVCCSQSKYGKDFFQREDFPLNLSVVWWLLFFFQLKTWTWFWSSKINKKSQTENVFFKSEVKKKKNVPNFLIFCHLLLIRTWLSKNIWYGWQIYFSKSIYKTIFKLLLFLEWKQDYKPQRRNYLKMHQIERWIYCGIFIES